MSVFVENDNTTYYVYCKRKDGTAFDVTNYTPTLRFSINGATAVEKAMTKEDNENGEISYRFEDGELVSGEIKLEVFLTDGVGKKITSRDIKVHTIRKKVG